MFIIKRSLSYPFVYHYRIPLYSLQFLFFYLKGSMFDNIGADLPRGLFPCFATLKTKTESVPQVFRSWNPIYYVKVPGFYQYFHMSALFTTTNTPHEILKDSGRNSSNIFGPGIIPEDHCSPTKKIIWNKFYVEVCFNFLKQNVARINVQ